MAGIPATITAMIPPRICSNDIIDPWGGKALMAFWPFMRSALVTLWPRSQRRELFNDLGRCAQGFIDLLRMQIIEVDEPALHQGFTGGLESREASLWIDIDNTPGTPDIAERHHVTDLDGGLAHDPSVRITLSLAFALRLDVLDCLKRHIFEPTKFPQRFGIAVNAEPCSQYFLLAGQQPGEGHSQPVYPQVLGRIIMRLEAIPISQIFLFFVTVLICSRKLALH